MIGIELFVALLLSGIFGGYIGSLVGLGGGFVIMPVLTIFLGVPIEYAAGASLIATIATSSGAASAYVRDRIANMKIGMSLEIGTTAGAIIGALVAVFIYDRGLQSVIYIIFGVALISSIYPTLRKASRAGMAPARQDSTTRIFQLKGKYFDKQLGKTVRYYGIRWWTGALVMLFAGIISGLLGVGSGALKVLGLDDAMNLPDKVSTTTSNFMIGVTAAVGSAIYWNAGYIEPFIAGASVIGVLIGAYAGSKALPGMKNSSVRNLFLVIIFVLAVEMIYRGI